MSEMDKASTITDSNITKNFFRGYFSIPHFGTAGGEALAEDCVRADGEDSAGRPWKEDGGGLVGVTQRRMRVLRRQLKGREE